MKKSVVIIMAAILFGSHHLCAFAAKSIEKHYAPSKVVYDVNNIDEKALKNIFDRLSYLFKMYDSDVMDSSIIVVIHGEAIKFFALENNKRYEHLMRRAKSLTVGTTIEFRMCRAAAKLMNYEAKHIQDFVYMVPMADAEIVYLQNRGYAYLQ